MTKHDRTSMLSTAEVARRLGVSSMTVIRWITSRKLAAYKFGTGNYRIERRELERFLEASRHDRAARHLALPPPLAASA